MNVRHIRAAAIRVVIPTLFAVAAHAETAPPPSTSELPQALFILPWQPQGQVPEARKRWLDKLPPGHVNTVDERELKRRVNYHAVLSRTVPAADRGRGAQEE